MLGKLAPESPVIRATFDSASKVLGYDLWSLCQNGPAEQLNSTEKTQPAMLAAGVATLRLWQERGGALPSVVTGHSLGEFTALVAASAIGFEECIDLVRFRGQVMQEAVPAGTGSMAALLGLEDAEVEAACAEAAQALGAVVEAVNYNSPGQVVIAGEKAAVQRAIELAKARGAKRAVELPVSVPSHSSLMKSAGARLGERLAQMDIGTPRIRYLSAVDAREHDAADDIRQLLVRQLSSPVRWTATVAALGDAGTRFAVECGPGGVLAGLVKRISRGSDLQTFALESPDNLATAITAVAA
jgi:[acyl-carrier-protein] S-malonyltransferase